MKEYQEEDYLQLSGIQHFAFCPRQWALIHIEEQWTENYLTAGGRLLHTRAHDSTQFEKRGDILIARALKISSRTLGLSGECDVVEFHLDSEGIVLKNYEDRYIPYPVEYKRGKEKIDDCDRLQLCAQAMCLEEMLGCTIKKGALFYGTIRRREEVIISQTLREKVIKCSEAMHLLFNRKYTPKAQIGDYCISCSLNTECLPRLAKKHKNVKKYLEDNCDEEIT